MLKPRCVKNIAVSNPLAARLCLRRAVRVARNLALLNLKAEYRAGTIPKKIGIVNRDYCKGIDSFTV